MFRFANFGFLYFLLVIPLLVLIYILMQYFHRRAMMRFTDKEFFNTLMPLRSMARRNFKFILFLSALTLLIIAVARPQFGSKLEQIKREGIEMIIALDVSRSMMAEDVKPNRLERAKQAIVELINLMKDDKIGLIIFAGDAYTQLPITADYISAKMFLLNISPEVVSKQGTAIASAIELGTKSFSQDPKAAKVIVIISDGEDHIGDPVQAAKDAVEKGIKVFTIGMGSPTGSPIPLTNSGSQSGFLKDRNGDVIISRMDPTTLSKIAESGGGEFFSASTSNVGLDRLYNKLNKLNKSEIETRVYSEYDDQFPYLIFASLLLLVFDLLILERKNQNWKGFKLFEK
jgi:Ca-activated chloride channel family protein